MSMPTLAMKCSFCGHQVKLTQHGRYLSVERHRDRYGTGVCEGSAKVIAGEEAADDDPNE